MAKQGEAAYAYFLKGYNCSQSVVAAFAPQLGLSEEMALRMSAGFGAGIGRMREVCGAFCGVVTVLSLVYADPADPQDKSRMYALVQEAARLYRARNGGDSIICRELLAKAGAAPSGRHEGRGPHGGVLPQAALPGAVPDVRRPVCGIHRSPPGGPLRRV